MRKFHFITGMLSFTLILFLSGILNAQVFKLIRVGNYRGRVHDSAAQSVQEGQRQLAFYEYDGFTRMPLRSAAFRFGCRDWTDENGAYWPVRIAGAATVTRNNEFNMMPLPDGEQITIRKYMRYHPPTIDVDGFRLEDPFPLLGDEVNPDKIPGTADIMIESRARTIMGLDVHQKVLAWSQTHHDDYIIYDMTLINTGNVDLDDEVELPNQTLTDLYILRTHRNELGNEYWYSCVGEFPEDTLRMMYTYPGRNDASTWDNTGWYRTWGFLPWSCGEAMLHVGKYANGVSTDDPDQPRMTCVGNTETGWEREDATQLGPSDLANVYNWMQNGFPADVGTGAPYMENTRPGAHAVRHDELGVKFPRTATWYVWGALAANASGPFTLGPGDSIRIVWAGVLGCVSQEKGRQVERDWENGICEPPEGFEMGVNDNMPPPYKQYPELYAEDARSTEYNNWAKDCWVFTGRDSLFKNAWAAQWNCRNGYNVPVPPPPPSIKVQSKPDNITVSWSDDSESASDFAGYRVYRATGSPWYSIDASDQIAGKWNKIFECGQGTPNAVTHKYEDTTAVRGVDYYYYVTAYDDGTENGPDVYNPQGGEILESGKYANMTTQSARLQRPAGTLSKARVVPNPFHISATELQFPGADHRNKIMFLEIPAECTIKIYTESGDLVKTIEHSGSGDESWGIIAPQEYQTTNLGQIVVSGIYIAYIETPEGESTYLKFVVIR